MQDITSEEALIKWRVQSANIQRLDTKKDNLQKEIQELHKNIEDWNGAKLLLEHLKNYKLEKRKVFILGVINSAMKDIFESDYKLDIQPRETKGKSIASAQKYDIIFYQNGIEMARNHELLSSNGGGVLSIASLFFKILIGYLYSKNKFYIFDESLSQVSPQFRTRLSRFLREFCEQYGFTLVVVSQTEELEEHAHLVYEVDSNIDKNNIPVLDIVNTIGDIPQEDYFYSKLQNFQSVVNATFLYKGFTIIRGPNNSGKSATLRAIDALIFNNFNTENYPRKNPDGRLTTEITFGYMGKKETIPKEIGLKYKGNKVMFIIEGQEYFGKSLAADKLKEAVEDIGFKYIDVKKMYKNFKGALKEQTERIAYTNQYDGLFLIGAKTTDSEKIFSFLFNTENIALAIAQSKETILEFAKYHKDKQQELINVEEELSTIKITTEYYLKVYYYKIIHEITALEKDLAQFRDKTNLYKNSIENIQYFIAVVDNAVWLETNTNLLNELRNKVLHNNTQEVLVEKILSEVDAANLIQGYLNLNNTIQKYYTKLDALNQLTPKIQNVLSYNYLIDIQKKLNLERTKLGNFQIQKQELDVEFSLTECITCGGLGVTPR